MASGLRSLRGLIRELRSRTVKKKAGETLAVPYVLSEYRKFQITGEILCRERDEAQSLGQAYQSYLESSRKHAVLLHHYHGRGERSVENTAKLVGFKLPNEPEK